MNSQKRLKRSKKQPEKNHDYDGWKKAAFGSQEIRPWRAIHEPSNTIGYHPIPSNTTQYHPIPQLLMILKYFNDSFM